MIEPEELRIGSLVTINNNIHWPELKGLPLCVAGINERLGHDHETTFSVSVVDKETNGNFSQFIKFIEPIPLTEEWLVKFGFQKARIDSRYYKLQYSERGTYLLNRPGSGYTEVCIEGTTTAQGPTESVHQLQNLYFALTGMELTIKE